MPFMKGQAALRRTLGWLQKGEIKFRHDIQIVTMNYNPGTNNPHHSGLHKFVFWHLPQLAYKNPDVQFITYKYMTPTPWVKLYMEDDRQFLVDCDSRSRQEIHDHIKDVFNIPQDEESQEATAIQENPANFGEFCPRQCACELPGHVACPGFAALPFHLRGKQQTKVRAGEMTMEELIQDSETDMQQRLENRRNKLEKIDAAVSGIEPQYSTRQSWTGVLPPHKRH